MVRNYIPYLLMRAPYRAFIIYDSFLYISTNVLVVFQENSGYFGLPLLSVNIRRLRVRNVIIAFSSSFLSLVSCARTLRIGYIKCGDFFYP